MVRRNLSLRLKEHKGCKQTEHDYTTRRDFLFLKVNKTFNGKSKICRPNSSNCQYACGQKFEKKWKNIKVKRQCKFKIRVELPNRERSVSLGTSCEKGKLEK